MTRFFESMLYIFFVACIVSMAAISIAHAQDASSTQVARAASTAVAVPVIATALSYGDIVDFDTDHGIYVLSQFADDPYVFGIAAKDPPLVYIQHEGDVPVVRSGAVPVNVTLENGPIALGDSIIASSIPGKGMRADEKSSSIIGTASQPFSGKNASTTITIDGTAVAAGTILVQLSDRLASHALEAGTLASFAQFNDQICSKWFGCIPAGVLMRYVTAALVAFGSVYLAFKSFMAGAANGIISMGRNPRAQSMIQNMVAFNAVLAVTLAMAGLGAGLVILFIQI